jgi:hypothetical protein
VVADAERPQLPQATGTTADLRGVVVGCLSSVGVFALCLVASTALANWATRDLARDEVYNALYADGVFAQWWCGGAVVSVGLAVLAGAVCGRWARGGRPN